MTRERLGGIPKKTLQDTLYCVRIWEEWREYRQQAIGDSRAALTEITKLELQPWLTRFILEVRKKDGSVYPPNMLYHLFAGIMCHLRWAGMPETDLVFTLC